MSEADHSRIRAAKFQTQAQNETDPELRAVQKLAEKTDRHIQTDIEPPLPTLLFSYFVTWELPPVLAASLMPVALRSAAAPRPPNSKSK